MAGSYDAFSGTSLATRCYESHPVLKLGKGKLYGGSARWPKIKDADVYVVLQSGDMDGRQSDPWEKQQVIEIQYAIRDMGIPKDVSRFKKMVTWLCNQLHEGKSVHVGCIGGHGRTGTLLSAIIAEAGAKKDAIQWVRKHYCKKAVESKEQVQFLMKHYGVTKVEPTKSSFPLLSSSSRGNGQSSFSDFVTGSSQQKPLLEMRSSKTVKPEGVSSSTKSYTPIESSRSLWKRRG